MAWFTAVAKDWKTFVEVAGTHSIGSPLGTSFLFRGQSNARWGLQSSLQRRLPPGLDIKRGLDIEGALLRKFQSEAHIHVSRALLPEGKEPLAWWPTMQHYGAPTRMLDWTESPFVAAYFAVAENWEEDGMIWVVHPANLLASLKSRSVKDFANSVLLADAPDEILVLPMSRHTERTVAQQGHFTLTARLDGDQEQLVDKWHGGAHPIHKKITIPSSVKPQFLRELRTMNVTAAALFPGLDGLGRSMGELARLAAN